MAQTQWHSSVGRPTYFENPEQRAPRPQLPPIHSLSSGRSFDAGRHPVQLPPMQLSQSAVDCSVKTNPTRSIPVAHLLSSNPPSPKSQPSVVSQRGDQGLSPTSSIGSPKSDYHTRRPSFPHPPAHRLEQASIPLRPQPPPAYYKAEQRRGSHYPPPHPSVKLEPTRHHWHHSPTVSTYSTPSYAPSESSPRSSIGPQSQSTTTSRPFVNQPPPLNYNLSIRQQPAAARACGFGERDRRVIDPPPILELKITDRATGAPEQDLNGMIALHCTLLSPDGIDDETELPPAHPDMPSTRRLMGSMVASPYQAKDENGTAGTFFVFPDLSCRSPGKYRLKFKLLRVDPMNLSAGSRFNGNVSSIVSDVFSVYTAKDFPGMRASSALLKALRRQGLNVGVKKGSDARKGKGKSRKETASSPSSSDGEEDSDGDAGARPPSSDDISPKTKLKKKVKRRRKNE